MRSLFITLTSFVILCFGSMNKAHATHFAGADFSMRCLGGDTFLITFNLFRDCSGVGAPTSVNITLSSPCSTFTQTWQRDSLLEVSQLCPSAINNSSCNGGNLPGMQQNIYSQIVHLPPCNLGPWTASWTSCCRNSSQNLQGQDSFWISGQVNNGQAPCNSTPQFNAQPIPYVCANQQVVYNFGVTEIDGDSLVYELGTPYASNVNDTVPFSTGSGYFNQNPFNVPANLNPQTGELTFTPTTNGFWVVKVCVKEYRNGVQIGQICRDIQFVVESCNNVVPFMNPLGIQGFTGSGQQLDSNSVEVCIGNNFSFFIEFGDSLQPGDPNATPPVLPQTFGDSVTLSSNIQQVLPGANVTIVNGNPASITVSWTAVPGTAPFTTFVVNAVDDACNVSGITSAAFDVTVVPATYAGPDQRLCQGEDTAFVNVVGGTEFEWSVISGDPLLFGVNFSDTTGTNGQNVWMFPNKPTTYQVVSNLSGACINTDTITIIPSRNFTLNMFGDTLVCPNDSISNFLLSAIPDTGTTTVPFDFNYQWTGGTLLDFDTIQSPTATINETRTFQVTVASDSGCVKSGEVTVTFAPNFPDSIGISFLDSILCIGDSTQAFVDFGAVIGANCGLATAPCGSNSATSVIGTGTATNTTTSYPAPYGNWYWGARHQIMFTAAELQAMGMTNGGKINSIAFDVTGINGTSNYTGFTIRMGCTSANNLSANWITGTQTVYGPVNYNVTTGWNTHLFTTPYDWDGTSNLVIEVCFNNTSFTNNSATTYTNTGAFTSVRYFRADQSGVCTNNALTATSNLRPNVQFNYCTGYDPGAFNYQWSPNTQVSNSTIFDPMVTALAPTNFNVIVSDTFGACVDTASRTLNILTFYNAGFELDSVYCLNSDADTAFNVVTPGGTWSGNGIIDSLAGVFDPAVAGIGTHPITYTVTSPSGGCVSDSTINVVVIPLPDASITSPLEFCKTGGPYQLTAATSGGVWSGIGVIDPAAGIYDPTQTPSTGSYTIIYDLTTPCLNADTVDILNYEAYDFDFVDTPRTVCVNDTLILSNNFEPKTGPQYSTRPGIYIWSGPGITDPDSGYFDPANVGVGTQLVFLTASDSSGNCATTDTMRIQVYGIDTPFVTNPLIYCSTDNSGLVAIDKGFGSSSNWTTSPIPPTTTNISITSSGTFSPISAGPGQWIVDYAYTNLNGCTGFLIDTITVLETPPTPVIDSNTFCAGEEVTLTSTNGNNSDSLFWYSSPLADPASQIGNGTPFFYGIAQDPNVTGAIFVYAQEVNQICASPVVTHVLPIVPDPNAEFFRYYTDSNGVEQVDVPMGEYIRGLSPLSIEFQALNLEPGDSVYWDLWFGCDPSVDSRFGCPIIDDLNRPRAAFTYQKEGIYQVMLIHSNPFGCVDTIYAQHEVLFEAEVPNVFTPNGDGVNDVFRIPGAESLREFNCEIYNRWGRKVYEWSNPDDGWDGDGYSDGVYFYIVTGKRAGNEDFLEQGTVTLVGGN